MRHRTAAIVPAAGSGRRLGLPAKKPFVLLGGEPLVLHALRALDASPAVDAIYIAADRESVGRVRSLVEKAKLGKVAKVVVGGKTRTESVGNCLAALDPSVGTVLIHDAARPFVDERMIAGSVRLAKRHGAAVVAVPEIDTVKEVSRGAAIVRTLDRKNIYRAQTPQVFRRALLEKAYRRAQKNKATDDASLVEALGVAVRICEGSYRNMKITTKVDLHIAQMLLKSGRVA